MYLDEFAPPIPGREDPPDVVQACVDYLERYSRGRAPMSHRQRADDVVVRSALAAARVQASTVAASGAMARRFAELTATVVQQQTTIDHLLAHIPGRMQELPRERLDAVRVQVAAWAREIFELGAPPDVEVQADRDRGSEACHRIVVHVPTPAEVNPEEYVRREITLHLRLAETLGGDEFRAVQLIVEPKPST